MALIDVDKMLHPNGRCRCCGEGTCGWCREAERLMKFGPNCTCGHLIEAHYASDGVCFECGTACYGDTTNG